MKVTEGNERRPGPARPRTGGPWVALALSLALGCASGEREDRGRALSRLTPRPVQASLPEAPAPFAPSLLRVTSRDPGAGARLADVDGCADCHTDVFAAWRTSAHAFASFNNPIYRTSIERLRRDRGAKESRVCAGCHDLALLVDGAMDADIRPDDPRAHAGVSCRVCHGVVATRSDGNGSLDLDTGEIPYPRTGDVESIARHKARVAMKPLRTAELCAGCHKAFLDESAGTSRHLVGQDDASPWARSAYAGSHAARVDVEVPERDCTSCHMPREPSLGADPGAKNATLASHRFLGAHTWLASMQNDPSLVDRAEAFLRGSATVDVTGLRRADGRRVFLGEEPVPLRAGERVVLDVVVKNERAGHRFPGGVMDAQDTWLEITVIDSRGRRLAESGTQQEQTGSDPTAHRLFSYMADAAGKELRQRETHEFRANVYNNTIPARDAVVIGFALDTPASMGDAELPLRVTARLRHRTRNLALRNAACADARSERGRAFGREGLKKVARALDPCQREPVVDIARSEASLGGGPASPAPDHRTFARSFAWSQGLSHALQEHLDDARGPLALALTSARTDRERAMATSLLAELEAHEGRHREAFLQADRAEELLGGTPHPALERIRGEAHLPLWRWAEAAARFEEAARLAPGDDTVFVAWAIAAGGGGDAWGALGAARSGLALQPRDSDLLRVQALSLESLGASPGLLEQANAAFLARRTPDDAPGIRGRCSRNVPGCANERNPVHVRELVSPRR